ncbi:methylated-DNA--[protein]-cysteine S-methyltransferase [Arcticibacter eurypsychrophilus]|uniref:methylated-DNA--[protein]-cysteine S-methyltransferase n=1 Tax=Arcticibacter eurypsychrophilus TaxID=1434752 RepID=UPI0009F3F761|nr:methylated-DNA--[protein]-cysteine S-methyltransferase [Arcticibacter eurypsychrophilus]
MEPQFSSTIKSPLGDIAIYATETAVYEIKFLEDRKIILENSTKIGSLQNGIAAQENKKDDVNILDNSKAIPKKATDEIRFLEDHTGVAERSTKRIGSIDDRQAGSKNINNEISILEDNNPILEIFNSKGGASTDRNPIPENTNTVIELCKSQLNAYFNGDSLSFDFPMLPQGTPFQQRVWTNLCEIPAGTPISYARLSTLMKQPLAIRAIANANARNKLAIVIPCHRVIGSSGDLVGYAGGLWRKKWLLEHEAKVTKQGQTLLF